MSESTDFHIPNEVVVALGKARKVVVFTGAGVSAESGIATFRDKTTGLWARYNPHELATPAAFQANPPLVWGWYEARRRDIAQAQPNPAHVAIAQLNEVVPEVIVVTQNVDNLHERAGSNPVLHLHGRLDKARCFRCERPYKHTGPASNDDAEVEPPRCAHCGGLVRPGVVWFGEGLPESQWAQAAKHVSDCNALLSVGTSAVVYPAAELPLMAVERGATVVQINPQPTDLNAHAHFNLHGKAGTVMPALLKACQRAGSQ